MVARSGALSERDVGQAEHWLTASSAMADVIRRHNWDGHVLGPCASWPGMLKATLNIMLSSPLPMNVLWGEDQILLYNDAYADFIGSLHPTIFGQPAMVAFPNSSDVMIDARRRAFQGEQITFVDHQLHIRRHDVVGDFFLHLSYSPIRVSADEIGGVLVILLDVTAAHTLATSVKESEAFVRSVLNSSPDSVQVIDLKGNLLSMNENGCQSMEIDDFPQLIAQPWISFWEGDHKSLASDALARAQAGETARFEGCCATAKGNARWWEVMLTPVVSAEENTPQRILVISRDVTERREADNIVRDLQSHLQLMIESAADFAIISMNKEGEIVSWNSGAELIFGLKEIHAKGKPIDIIFTPDDRANGIPDHELEVARRLGKAPDERWHLHENGTRFWASGVMAAMRDQNGQLKGYMKIVRDVTATKEREAHIAAAKEAAEHANMAKSEFLANMSHEIRTPMNAIVGLSHLLMTTAPLTNRQTEFIKTLQTSADSLLGLVNDLLDISKIESRSVELEVGPFSITRLTQEVISMMAVRVREKDLTFTASGECVQNRMFLGDRTRIRQIVLNLCSNAVKFTDHGSIHLSITCHPHADPGSELISIAVTDTGIGIPPDKLDAIFSKFTQADASISRKYGGTGLGLAITKTLTEMMGGSVSVTSKLGQGSTFTASLPLKKCDEETDESLPLAGLNEAKAAPSVERPILLVEDYEPNILVATTFLEDFGYKVEVARNGLDAVQMIKTQRFSLVLMDVQMFGMNGLKATEVVRQWEKENKLPPIPIMGMTAHALAGDRERCIAVGMNDYVSKPFNPREFQEKVKTLLDAKY